MTLLKYIAANNYTIKLIRDQQLHYRLIYSLRLVEQKFLKMCIKVNLANGFIKSFQFLVEAFIFFDK